MPSPRSFTPIASTGPTSFDRARSRKIWARICSNTSLLASPSVEQARRSPVWARECVPCLTWSVGLVPLSLGGDEFRGATEVTQGRSHPASTLAAAAPRLTGGSFRCARRRACRHARRAVLCAGRSEKVLPPSATGGSWCSVPSWGRRIGLPQIEAAFRRRNGRPYGVLMARSQATRCSANRNRRQTGETTLEPSAPRARGPAKERDMGERPFFVDV
jgi:hypothetical protein